MRVGEAAWPHLIPSPLMDVTNHMQMHAVRVPSPKTPRFCVGVRQGLSTLD